MRPHPDDIYELHEFPPSQRLLDFKRLKKENAELRDLLQREQKISAKFVEMLMELETDISGMSRIVQAAIEYHKQSTSGDVDFVNALTVHEDMIDCVELYREICKQNGW